MKTIKVKELNRDDFALFGEFAVMIAPPEYHFGDSPVRFYRDILQLHSGGGTMPSFSVCRAEKRPLIIEKAEYHSETGEGILPLDGDVVVHVAPATRPDTVPLDEFRAFRLPQGTMAVLKPGVWHHAPFPLEKDVVNTLIVLPERTYANDCRVVEMEQDDRIKIERQ